MFPHELLRLGHGAAGHVQGRGHADDGADERLARVGVNPDLHRQGALGHAAADLAADLHLAPMIAYFDMAPQGRALLRQAMERLGLSARGYHRVLRVARSIADLAGERDVLTAHLAEQALRNFELAGLELGAGGDGRAAAPRRRRSRRDRAGSGGTDASRRRGGADPVH